jgi:hypothetical protein
MSKQDPKRNKALAQQIDKERQEGISKFAIMMAAERAKKGIVESFTGKTQVHFCEKGKGCDEVTISTKEKNDFVTELKEKITPPKLTRAMLRITDRLKLAKKYNDTQREALNKALVTAVKKEKMVDSVVKQVEDKAVDDLIESIVNRIKKDKSIEEMSTDLTDDVLKGAIEELYKETKEEYEQKIKEIINQKIADTKEKRKEDIKKMVEEILRKNKILTTDFDKPTDRTDIETHLLDEFVLLFEGLIFSGEHVDKLTGLLEKIKNGSTIPLSQDKTPFKLIENHHKIILEFINKTSWGTPIFTETEKTFLTGLLEKIIMGTNALIEQNNIDRPDDLGLFGGYYHKTGYSHKTRKTKSKRTPKKGRKSRVSLYDTY